MKRNPITEIRHDGLARQTLYRERIRYIGQECAECGGVAQFRYCWVNDDKKTPHTLPGKDFCSVGCWRVQCE